MSQEVAAGDRSLKLQGSWGNIGIMEKKTETLGPLKGLYRDFIGFILGYYWENGKENEKLQRLQGL